MMPHPTGILSRENMHIEIKSRVPGNHADFGFRLHGLS
jgi:hypothetical protein